MQVYPGILAQTIYMIFHDAFPDSHKMFGPLFKEEVVRYCWELTTGKQGTCGVNCALAIRLMIDIFGVVSPYYYKHSSSNATKIVVECLYGLVYELQTIKKKS